MMIPLNIYKFPEVITNNTYRNRKHSRLMRFFFPDLIDSDEGVDLPALSEKGRSVEIKECFVKHRMEIIIHLKDMDANYILFFYWKTRTFYLLFTEDFLYTSKKDHQGFGKKFILSHAIKTFKISQKMNKKIIDKIRNYVDNIRYGIINPIFTEK